MISTRYVNLTNLSLKVEVSLMRTLIIETVMLTCYFSGEVYLYLVVYIYIYISLLVWCGVQFSWVFFFYFLLSLIFLCFVHLYAISLSNFWDILGQLGRLGDEFGAFRLFS